MRHFCKMTESICIAHGEHPGIESGGTIRVSHLAGALVEEGYDVHLVAPKPTVDNRLPEPLANVTIHTVSISSRGAKDQLPRALFVSRRAKRIAAEHDAHLQFERATMAGIGTLIGCRDYVLDLHDIGYNGPLYANLPFALPVQRFVYWMESRGVRRANEVIAVSERMAEFVVDEWGVDPGSVHVIPNGVRSSVFEFRDESIQETDQAIGFIGNLNQNIDYDKIVRLARELPDAEIHVIGDGRMRSKFEALVEREKVDNVIIHGFLPDEEAYTILQQSQVCIFPVKDTHHTRVAQHMKGFDYAAMGRAIATDRDGTAQILDDLDAALVSDPGQPNELVENVKRLLDDAELRARLIENAERLVEEYTWERQGDRLVNLYRAAYDAPKSNMPD